MERNFVVLIGRVGRTLSEASAEAGFVRRAATGIAPSRGEKTCGGLPRCVHDDNGTNRQTNYFFFFVFANLCRTAKLSERG